MPASTPRCPKRRLTVLDPVNISAIAEHALLDLEAHVARHRQQ
jgi:hypothetical protein